MKTLLSDLPTRFNSYFGNSIGDRFFNLMEYDFPRSATKDDFDKFYTKTVKTVDYGDLYRPTYMREEDSDNNLMFNFVLPGLSKEQIEVSSKHEKNGCVLYINLDLSNLKNKFLHKYYGSENCKQYYIPNPEALDMDSIEASYDQGILIVTFPRKAQVKPKTIEVK